VIRGHGRLALLPALYSVVHFGLGLIAPIHRTYILITLSLFEWHGILSVDSWDKHSSSQMVKSRIHIFGRQGDSCGAPIKMKHFGFWFVLVFWFRSMVVDHNCNSGLREEWITRMTIFSYEKVAALSVPPSVIPIAS
jgi:hypothetical protein